MLAGKSHAVDQESVDGRACDSGDGREQQGAQIVRLQSGIVQCEAERLLPQFLCDLDPDVIGLAPGLDVHVLLCGDREVTAIHGHVAVQPCQQQRILEFGLPNSPGGAQEEISGSSNASGMRSPRLRSSWLLSPEVSLGTESSPIADRIWEASSRFDVWSRDS